MNYLFIVNAQFDSLCFLIQKTESLYWDHLYVQTYFYHFFPSCPTCPFSYPLLGFIADEGHMYHSLLSCSASLEVIYSMRVNYHFGSMITHTQQTLVTLNGLASPQITP